MVLRALVTAAKASNKNLKLEDIHRKSVAILASLKLCGEANTYEAALWTYVVERLGKVLANRESLLSTAAVRSPELLSRLPDQD